MSPGVLIPLGLGFFGRRQVGMRHAPTAPFCPSAPGGPIWAVGGHFLSQACGAAGELVIPLLYRGCIRVDV
eukprot:2625017-Pyramimonas_sp.AAC.1